METRYCINCEVDKPVTPEYWYLKNGKPWRRICRICQKAENKAKNWGKPAKQLDRHPPRWNYDTKQAEVERYVSDQLEEYADYFSDHEWDKFCDNSIGLSAQ